MRHKSEDAQPGWVALHQTVHGDPHATLVRVAAWRAWIGAGILVGSIVGGVVWSHLDPATLDLTDLHHYPAPGTTAPHEWGSPRYLTPRGHVS